MADPAERRPLPDADVLEHAEEGLAPDALHREEGLSVRSEADVVDGDDRGVLEDRLDSRLS
jgi:hypothetical protein